MSVAEQAGTSTEPVRQLAPDEEAMGLTFEWDEAKDFSNQAKHGFAFDEAKTVFNDPRSITIADEQHADEEDRYLDIGIPANDRRFLHRARFKRSHHQLPQSTLIGLIPRKRRRAANK
jgi:uncharacterized DUF497 family protein